MRRDLKTSTRVARVLLQRPNWNVSQVANALAISPSSLRRHLRAEGTGFSAIRQSVIVHTARKRLRTGPVSGKVVAAEFGLHANSFYRALYREGLHWMDMKKEAA